MPDCPLELCTETSEWVCPVCGRIVCKREGWDKPPRANCRSRGLGDTIAKATAAVGIKPCAGCNKRKEALNRWFPYKGETVDMDTTLPVMVAVAGPNRTGTSCVAGMLHKLGVPMGSQFNPANSRNPKGYYEDTTLKQYMDTNPGRRASAEVVEWFRRWADERRESDIVGCKHPRLCNNLQHMAMVWPVLKVIATSRPIEDSWESLKKAGWAPRDRRPQIRRFYRKRDNVVSGLGLPVLNLEYDRVIREPEAVVDDMIRFLEITPTTEQRQAAIEHVDPTLCHFNSLAQQDGESLAVDVVYPLSDRVKGGSTWGNNEIRYSLRSLEKYASHLGRVFVVTENLPHWMQNVVHVKVADQRKRNKDANIIDKIRAAIKAGCSERFIFASDDQYLVAPTDLATLPVTVARASGKGRWLKRWEHTVEHLQSNGKPALFYESHLFQPHDAGQFERAVAEVDYSTNPGFTINSIAFNRYDPPPESVPRRDMAGTVMGNYGHNPPDKLRIEMQSQFSTPSKYEAVTARVTGGGRGIVTLAGGPLYFINAYINCALLRANGCKLPIEWFFLGPEMPEQWQQAITRDIPDVRLIDLGGTSTDNRKRRGGWQAKVEAIVASQFEELLFLDADSFPRRDPTELFDHPVFQNHHAVFWPDCRVFRDRRRQVLQQEYGVPIPSRQIESGQMLFRKPDAMPGLEKTLAINRNSARAYELMHGDKDTFQIGALQAGVAFAVNPHLPDQVPGALVQMDFSGSPMFTHLVKAKWRPRRQSRIHPDHFPRYDEAVSLHAAATGALRQECDEVQPLQYTDAISRVEATSILCNDMYQIRPMVGQRTSVQYIVDIGANVGAFSLQAATLYPEANIILIEPNPKSMVMARANTREFSTRIHYCQFACVGPGRGDTVMLYCPAQTACGSHIEGMFGWNPDTQGSEPFPVAAATLPALLEQCAFPRIDILKMDAEGVEGEVLTHLKNTGWLKKTRWIRGEWHGDDVPVIEAALADSHVCKCHRGTTNSGFIAHNRKDT